MILLNLGGEINNHRLMTTGLCKAQQVFARKGCGGGVDQRVAVDFFVFHQPVVNSESERAFTVIDDAKGRHRAGGYTQHFFHLFGAAKGEATGATQQFVQGFQIDLRVFLSGQKKIIALLVLQEQVLGVTTFYLATQLLAVIDGKQRRMFDCLGFKSSGIQIGQQSIAAHGRSWQLSGRIDGILVGHDVTQMRLDLVEG